MELSTADDVAVSQQAGDRVRIRWRHGSEWDQFGLVDADSGFVDPEDALWWMLRHGAPVDLVRVALGAAFPEFNVDAEIDHTTMPDRAERRAEDHERRRAAKAAHRESKSPTDLHKVAIPSLNPFERPLILIGYWNGSPGERGWPDVRDFVDENWDEDERLDVGSHLRNGLVARAWMGYSPCRLCDRTTNGNLDLTDGTYIWPEGLAHYVLDHSVRLPQEFVRHVHALNEYTDDITVDDSW